MRNFVGTGGCWLVLVVWISEQQAPPLPAFRTGIDAVQLDVSVLDATAGPCEA